MSTDSLHAENTSFIGGRAGLWCRKVPMNFLGLMAMQHEDKRFVDPKVLNGLELTTRQRRMAGR
jgi:hypothetical protein